MEKIFDGNMYLVGFMESGKSTLAPKLAEKLNRAFFDSDLWIENNSGKSIYQIFTEEGEESFRKIETDCIKMVLKMKHLVVAIGGGAIISSQNWINLKKSGIIIYLKCSLETIWQRIKKSANRPLLPKNSEEKYLQIKSLLTMRSPFYERADIIFSYKPGKSTKEVTDQLVKRIEELI